MPYTLSFIARKRSQIDSLNELPEEKRPTEKTIWDGSPEELEDWIDKVVRNKQKQTVDIELTDGDME